MNKDNAHEYLPIVQALSDKKTVQIQNYDESWSVITEFIFNLPVNRYRAKPETVKRYVATYYNGDGVYVSKPVDNRADLEAVAGMYKNFKIHELDCGKAP